MSARWWRWPEDARSGRVAWFVVARRMIFWPFFAMGVALCMVSIAAMYGTRSARDFWRDL